MSPLVPVTPLSFFSHTHAHDSLKLPRCFTYSRLEAFGRLLWDLFDKASDDQLAREQLPVDMSNYSAEEIDYCLNMQAARDLIMVVDSTIYRI